MPRPPSTLSKQTSTLTFTGGYIPLSIPRLSIFHIRITSSCKRIERSDIRTGEVGVFEGLVNLLSVTFEADNCKRIGSRAFKNCINLGSIELWGVEYVGSEAFSGCGSLGCVVFVNDGDNRHCSSASPVPVQQVPVRVLQVTNTMQPKIVTKIIEVTPTPTVVTLKNTWATSPAPAPAPPPATALTSTSTSTTTTSSCYIDWSSFHNCTNLTNVYMSNTVDYAPDAFTGCSKLYEQVNSSGESIDRVLRRNWRLRQLIGFKVVLVLSYNVLDMRRAWRIGGGYCDVKVPAEDNSVLAKVEELSILQTIYNKIESEDVRRYIFEFLDYEFMGEKVVFDRSLIIL